MRYTVTTRINDRPVSFRTPIADPFVHTTIRISRRDRIRSLLRPWMDVHVIVDGDSEAIRHVMGQGRAQAGTAERLVDHEKSIK
ncbi:hypothetical protein L3Q65_46060 [Amycolatopsis sp. FU40]|uniref:hypothetical protein n=1 Tax=Amycolatopsis sp. FU40 TaxID=2914159 RepID=UPI001F46FF47|nr:hypothetical protein [Amycolatopsis sp. FU40]UKD55140.1 hypothetical protein L3Q65_46060 [Amycolatopsis sp. FU40]